MFTFTRKKGEESKFTKALERMAERRGLKRRRSGRAQSVPPRQTTILPESSFNTGNGTDNSRPMVSRGRSASCTALDWFSGDMTWQDVEASGYLTRSGSYRSVEHEGPVLDVRHDCVKTASPTVVHQSRPHAIAPLSAELVAEGASSLTAGRSAPPPTPVTSLNYNATSGATVDDDRIDALAEVARRRRLSKPLITVDIPEGSLSPPAEIYQTIWGKL
ncbi:hypothetical protein NM688_g8202 [Phlebia brevispora]|uniref:Uncharacterized protein n=1 Tax=Phlebia brevispora TaxID=194682 RepID=A0ACC1RW70_9APHY|nr:hypothetical protein NM688_g8202 [Phlebia brevispora]